MMNNPQQKLKKQATMDMTKKSSAFFSFGDSHENTMPKTEEINDGSHPKYINNAATHAKKAKSTKSQMGNRTTVNSINANGRSEQILVTRCFISLYLLFQELLFHIKIKVKIWLAEKIFLIKTQPYSTVISKDKRLIFQLPCIPLAFVVQVIFKTAVIVPIQFVIFIQLPQNLVKNLLARKSCYLGKVHERVLVGVKSKGFCKIPRRRTKIIPVDNVRGQISAVCVHTSPAFYCGAVFQMGKIRLIFLQKSLVLQHHFFHISVYCIFKHLIFLVGKSDCFIFKEGIANFVLVLFCCKGSARPRRPRKSDRR